MPNEEIPLFSNTFRIRMSEDKVNLQFGFSEKQKPNNDDVSIVSSIELKPEMLIRLAVAIILSADDYQKKYDHKLGINLNFTNQKQNKSEGE